MANAYVGLLGHGIVGAGVAEILLKNEALINRRCENRVELKRICDLRQFNVTYKHLFTTNSCDIMSDPDISIVVECLGGVEPAFTMLKTALESGKHIVTSNKEVVVSKGAYLEELARTKGLSFLYEASVGGGIPILRPLRQCLAANEITKVMGILNGTTNYMLTRMRDGGVSFSSALKEAQDMGYAERDPSADILGKDTGRKINILSHAAFGAAFDESAALCQGIDNISKADMIYAMELSRVIKLIAVSCRTEGGYAAYVAPAMIPAGHPLAVVNDVINAVIVSGDMIGEAMFYGKGAGSLPTASAVCADIIDIARHMDRGGIPDGRVAQAAPAAMDAGQLPARLFVRFKGVKGGAEEALLTEKMPGARLLRLPQFPEEFAVITHEDTYAELMRQIETLSENAELIAVMRFEG